MKEVENPVIRCIPDSILFWWNRVARFGSDAVRQKQIAMALLLIYTLEAPIMTRLLCPFILIVFGVTQAAAQTADTIYFNGRVITMGEERPIVGAVAIGGGRFLNVGWNDDVMYSAGRATKEVEPS